MKAKKQKGAVLRAAVSDELPILKILKENRNPSDLTLRNLSAAKKREANLEGRIKALENERWNIMKVLLNWDDYLKDLEDRILKLEKRSKKS